MDTGTAVCVVLARISHGWFKSLKYMQIQWIYAAQTKRHIVPLF